MQMSGATAAANALSRGPRAWTPPGKVTNVGYCLWNVQEWWGVTHRWDDATIQALNVPRFLSPPPFGAPVLWTGGRKGHGHIAIMLDHGNILSTDVPRAGGIGVVPLEWVAENWSLNYVGWTDELGYSRLPLSTGAASSIPSVLTNPTPTAPVLTKPTTSPVKAAQIMREHDMFIVDQKERGIWVFGAGYSHHLNPVEWNAIDDSAPIRATLPTIKLEDGPVGITRFDQFRAVCTVRTA